MIKNASAVQDFLRSGINEGTLDGSMPSCNVADLKASGWASDYDNLWGICGLELA